MKKLKGILILSFIVTIGQVCGQGIEIEVLARPALTSLRGNDVVKKNLDPVIKFSTGLGVNYFLNDKSLLSLGIFYDRKGGRGKDEFFISTGPNPPDGTESVVVTNTVNFDYITIPIQWGQRFGQKIKYQFGIGVYTSLLLKCQVVTEGLTTERDDNTDTIKKLDVGLSASFNMLIPITKVVSVKAGIDDNYGLINVSDVPVYEDGTIKHNSLGLSAGLNIRLK